MKLNWTNKIVIIIALLGITSTALSQNCARKKFCDKDDYGNYDYRSQSSYAILSPGDTARASIVIYSRQDSRILVCYDPDLGNVQYKIFHPKRITRTVIKDIDKTETEIEVYKRDEDGNPVQMVDEWGDPVYDENYNPVYEIDHYETVVEYDTIWQKERVVEETLIFNSGKDGTAKPYWEGLNVKKTKRLIIEVIIPEGDRSIEGCVNIEVGHRQAQEDKRFYRY